MIQVINGPVLPHVQAFADEINRLFGFTHIMTYNGHSPSKERALDCFGTQEKMLELAWWGTRDDVIDKFGIDYNIFNANPKTVGGEIWNREIAKAWRQMPNRGSVTQNHHDHVHFSFELTGKVRIPATVIGPIAEKDDEDMKSVLWQEGAGPGKDGLYEVMGPIMRWVQNEHDFWALVNTGGLEMTMKDGKMIAVVHKPPLEAFYAKALVGKKPYAEYPGKVVASL